MNKIPQGIYGITAENLANGKSNLKCVEEMIKAGIKIIQYREKSKSTKEKLKEAKILAKICKDNDVIFIVNDHVDIALLCNADGIHIGQDDMDISDVRTLIGDDKIIGVSTHNISQAKKAKKDGANYIGVGPIHKTTTKDTKPVGYGYLEDVVMQIDIPFVAIGGIKELNIHEVVNRGAKTICLVSEIVSSSNIVEKVKSLQTIINSSNKK